MSKYKKFLKIFFGIFAAVILLAWIFLWLYIDDYDKNVSMNIVERITNQYRNSDGSGLLTHLGLKLNKYEDAQQFSEYLDDVIGGRSINYSTVTTSSVDSPEYIISAGDNVIEKVSFRIIGKTWLGHKKWDILSETTKFEPLYNGVTINAPSNAKIKINGISLVDKPMESDIILGLYENTPKGCFKPLFTSYTIDGFYCEPKITAVGANGEDCLINKDDETGTIYITTPASDEQYQVITKLTETFSANYYSYISGAAGFEVLSPYIYENCEFYEYIKSQNVRQLVGHDSSRLESVHIDNCQSYDDTQVSREVSFNFVYTVGGEEYEYPSAYEINYIKQGDAYKVVNLEAK